MSTTLVDVRETLNARRKSVHDLFAKYDDVGEMSDDDAAEVRRLNAETADLGKKFDDLRALSELKAQNEAERGRLAEPAAPMQFSLGERDRAEGMLPKQRKSVGEQWIESESFRQWQAGAGRRSLAAEVKRRGFERKATFTTGGAALTAYDRQPGIVIVGTQPPRVGDLLAQGTTQAPVVRYVQEVSFTNAATVVAEGGLKPEATFSTVEKDAPVRKIAVTAKVTDELFADFSAMRDYVNGRLDDMLELTEESEIISGDGTGVHLLGLLNTVGIQTQARGTDPNQDAVYKAMVKIMTIGFFEPDGVVMNPANWQAIRLLTTSTGQYIFGNPGDVAPQRLWGLSVVTTMGITAGTALVGAFRLGAQLFKRDEGVVEATNSNEDDFKRNLIALRTEERVALAVYRPLAFATVTGLL